MFVLYYPAAKAGFVSDFTGWLDQVKNHSFYDYINRSNFKVVSLYQFTQLVTYLFYLILGTNAWLWHLLFITLHVVNVCLMAIFCNRLLYDAGVTNHNAPIYIGSVLFCVTPYVSEVVVWEPSFHYLTGLLMVLLTLVWVQQYVYTQNRKYIILSGVVYLFSTHALEVFYVTPWLVLALALFYKKQSFVSKKVFWNVIWGFVIAELVIFVFRMAEFRLLYGDWVSRIGSGTVLSTQDTGFGKPAKYIFHLLLLGRYIPAEWHMGSIAVGDIKNYIYDFCDSTTGIICFYSICGILFVWVSLRFRTLTGFAQAISLLSFYTLVLLLLVSPLHFETNMLIKYDRYSYFACAFLFMVLVLCISNIPNKDVKWVVLSLLILANLRYSIQASRYWGKSSKIVDSLLHNLPPSGNKTIILLNLPHTMHGAAMIGASEQSEYKLMHNLLLHKPLPNKVFDVLGYNMLTPDDGAHVTVLNDSVVRVTLNQWGTWWWYEDRGGISYENEAYKLNLVDVGHFYELTLKNSSAQYLLLYNIGSKWKTVDMQKNNEEQN